MAGRVGLTVFSALSMSNDRRHPSGRPVRNERVISRPIWRIPDKGLITPRLQEPQNNLSAIGFVAQLMAREDDE